MKIWLLKLHRWLALVFAVPLLLVLATAVVLSVEPWLVTAAIKPGALTADRVTALLARHDPAGKESAIAYRSYDNTLAIGGRAGARIVDVASGELRPALSPTAATLLTARRLHETLLIDASWLVIASTVAMLVSIALGLFMGWPRLANTVSGWHKGLAWGLLPLLILSPLTGLFIAFGITFMPPAPPPASAPPLPLTEAIRILAAKHDLSGLVWLRPQGKRLLARIAEDGEYRVYAVTRDGTTATSRNWPRLWHEGNFVGAWSALMNLVTALAATGLLGTGLWIWARRKLRPRNRARGARPVAAG